MSDIEGRLLSKVINRRDLGQVLKAGIKTAFFHADNRSVWKYLTEYYAEHGVVPHASVIERNFPKFKIANTQAEPVTALLAEIKEREQYNKVRETIEEAGKLLADSDSDEAYKRIVQGVAEIASTVRDTEDSDWTKSAEDRGKLFDRKSKQKQFGIPTPWGTLNKHMLGFQDGHLITIAARPSTGKSWWICLCAHHAWASGHNVLIITKEMVSEEIERRLDAIHTKVPYADLRIAKLSPEDTKQYKRGLTDLMKSANTIQVTGAEVSDGGVMSLAAKIDEYSPDIVFVDGIYLLSDDRGGKSKVEQLYNITQDMKKLARRFKVPIIQSCQVKRGAHEDRGGSDQLATLQWSDSFSQDSDEVIKIYKNPDNPDQMVHCLIKQREGQLVDVKTYWNNPPMVFDEMGSSEPYTNAVDEDGKLTDSINKADDDEYSEAHRKIKFKLKRKELVDPNEV
jgi:replicative DNA helicase